MTATPRASTTVCVLREHNGVMEVLMVRRSPTARFMGGAWVFPGGVVDEADSSSRAAALVAGVGRAELGWVAAGLRELVEEVGVWITSTPFASRVPHGGGSVYADAERRSVRFDGAAMVLFANWITPVKSPMRFDARFYAVSVPTGVEPEPDDDEIDGAGWSRPEAIVERAGAGELLVPFPTRKSLELLAKFATPSDFFSHARSLDEVPVVRPRLRIGEDGGLEIVVPGEPGFDDIDEVGGPDFETMRVAARVSAQSGRPIPELGG